MVPARLGDHFAPVLVRIGPARAGSVAIFVLVECNVVILVSLDRAFGSDRRSDPSDRRSDPAIVILRSERVRAAFGECCTLRLRSNPAIARRLDRAFGVCDRAGHLDLDPDPDFDPGRGSWILDLGS